MLKGRIWCTEREVEGHVQLYVLCIIGPLNPSYNMESCQSVGRLLQNELHYISLYNES